MGSKHNLLCGVALAALSTSNAFAADLEDPAPAGSLPAVSGINGKLSGSGGFADDAGRGAADGSITIPIGHDFGAQFDGSLGSFDGDFTGTAMGHLFTRDPSSYLFGAGAMYQGIGSNDIFRIGPEVEFYLGQFSIEGFGGFEDADNGGNDFFFVGDVAFYPDDNLRISAGYSRALGIDAAQFGLEWLPNLDFGLPMSVFAQAQVGEGNFESAWFGIRFYFSDDPGKSLIRRHREDDPQFKGQQLERAGASDNCVPLVDAIMDESGLDNCGNLIEEEDKDEKKDK